eukprot:scaffold224224_cov28-Tisochrysis_lutea.AAC.15
MYTLGTRKPSKKKKSEDSGLHTYLRTVQSLATEHKSTPLSPFSPPPRLPPLVPLSLVSGVRPWYSTKGPVSGARSGQAICVVLFVRAGFPYSCRPRVVLRCVAVVVTGSLWVLL